MMVAGPELEHANREEEVASGKTEEWRLTSRLLVDFRGQMKNWEKTGL